jgi:hypothetical protein
MIELCKTDFQYEYNISLIVSDLLSDIWAAIKIKLKLILTDKFEVLLFPSLNFSLIVSGQTSGFF